MYQQAALPRTQKCLWYCAHSPGNRGFRSAKLFTTDSYENYNNLRAYELNFFSK